MIDLAFEAAPRISPWRAFWPRKPGLAPGESLPSGRAQVARLVPEGLSAYRKICGFPEDGPLPLPFPQVAAAPLHLAILTHPAFPLPALGLVHVANSIQQEQPLAENAPLSILCCIGDQRPAKRGIEFDLLTQVQQENAVIWRAATTILSRSAQGDPTAPMHQEPEEFETEGSSAWDLPADLGRRYGRIAGDRNPIHLYAWTARIFGFQRAISHGMWTMARALAELERAGGGADELNQARQLDVRFLRPVFLPSRPEFRFGNIGDSQAFVLKDPKTKKTHLYGRLGGLTG